MYVVDMDDKQAQIQLFPSNISLFPSSSLLTPLLTAFLSGRNPQTIRAYQLDLQTFTHFVKASTFEQAISLLFTQSQGAANALVLSYRHFLFEKRLAPATINRRLAAIRSLVKLARMLGVVSWSLDIEGIQNESYRDTSGPGISGVRKLLEVVEQKTDQKSKRDRAIFRLLFDVALRRAEVASLNIEDVDLENRKISILGKGRTAKEKITLPPKTALALEEWMRARGQKLGPLFLNYDPARKGNRLTGTSIYRMIRTLGNKAGMTVRPHGLRHAGITAALDATRGDVRKVQRFSRHKDVRTLTIYDDRRRDEAGEVACLISESI